MSRPRDSCVNNTRCQRELFAGVWYLLLDSFLTRAGARAQMCGLTRCYGEEEGIGPGTDPAADRPAGHGHATPSPAWPRRRTTAVTGPRVHVAAADAGRGARARYTGHET
ncbi:hypothetical protein GCM10017687_87640 [Streptomyces echinatus]